MEQDCPFYSKEQHLLWKHIKPQDDLVYEFEFYDILNSKPDPENREKYHYTLVKAKTLTEIPICDKDKIIDIIQKNRKLILHMPTKSLKIAWEHCFKPNFDYSKKEVNCKVILSRSTTKKMYFHSISFF